LVTLEHGSLSLNSLANSLGNLGTRKKTYNFNVFKEWSNREVEIPRIKVGKKQTVETLINKEALLLRKHMRNEQKVWVPRIGLN